MSEERLRPFGLLLLLGVTLMACGRQGSSPSPSPSTSAPVRLEAEAGTISPLAPQDIAEPRTGGKVIRDPYASGGQAVILLSNNDAVRFKLPGNFTPGRYTVKVDGRGEFNRGWPTVALENDRRRRMSVTTLDTKCYALRGFGEFDLRPNQEMSVSLINDRYDGPGQDRNAVVDYLLIEPVRTTPAPSPGSFVDQFGSCGNDSATDVAVDAGGNSYVVGTTDGALPGQTKSSPPYNPDAFIRKVDPQGRELWTRQFGPSGDPSVNNFGASLSKVSVDASGNVYVAGGVFSSRRGEMSAGESAVLLRKYTAEGQEVWTRQFGTVGNSTSGLGVDATGNVYVVGNTGELLPGQTGYDGPALLPGDGVAFVRKYTPGGDVLWTRQFAATQPAYNSNPPRDIPASLVSGAAVDSAGNVYVSGSTSAAFPGLTQVGGSNNAFVRKYSTGGVALWTRQLGTQPSPGDTHATSGVGVGVDAAGNSYLVGNIPATSLTDWAPLVGPNRTGNGPNFLSKYGPDGTPLWIRQFRSSGSLGAMVRGVAVDAPGNAFVVGETTLAVPGDPNVTNSDIFVVKYSPDGGLLATRQLDNPSTDDVSGAAVGTGGSVYLAGFTSGAFPNQTNSGLVDALLIKLTP